jgi:hypothetical protein
MVSNIFHSPGEFRQGSEAILVLNTLVACIEPNIGTAVRNRFHPAALPVFPGATICGIAITSGRPYYPYWDCPICSCKDGLGHLANEDIAERTFLISVHKSNVNGKIPF